jgi:hypothetical protein
MPSVLSRNRVHSFLSTEPDIKDRHRPDMERCRDPDDQLSSEGTPTLLQTSQFEQDEQTPSLSLIDDLGPSDYKSMDPYLFQDGPNFPLTKEDTDCCDYPDDASNISEDSDEDGYPVQRVSNIIEWNEDVFKDIEVPSTIIVDENP